MIYVVNYYCPFTFLGYYLQDEEIEEENLPSDNDDHLQNLQDMEKSLTLTHEGI